MMSCKKIFSLSVICLLMIPVAFSCEFGDTENKNHSEKTKDDSSYVMHPAAGVKDSAGQKTVLEEIYHQAIAEYIRLANKQYKLRYDTLFFGKHKNGKPEDFPDITLRPKIGKTKILLISPEEGEQKQKESKSSAYINLIGWVNETNAAFIFVTFTDGFVHQFDCFINYKFEPSKKKYLLENSRFVNYRKKTK